MNRIDEMKFEKAFATDTRLMGVVGMRIHMSSDEDSAVLFLHLDYESYGLDHYELLTNPSQAHVDAITDRVMGGLGGKMVPVGRQLASYLIDEAMEIGSSLSDEDEHVLDSLECGYDLLEAALAERELLCKEIESDYELINYFVMRYAGGDITILDYLAEDISGIDLRFEGDTTLLKNTINKSDDYYVADSLVVEDGSYGILRSKFELQEKKISSFEILGHLHISADEAYMQLRRTEYVCLYGLEDTLNPSGRISSILGRCMVNDHPSGKMITHFNPDNEHVGMKIYYLNDDVLAFFYITDSGQLITMALSEENLLMAQSMIEHVFENKLEYMGQMVFDSPVLFDFITSEMRDFREYLETERI